MKMNGVYGIIRPMENYPTAGEHRTL